METAGAPFCFHVDSLVPCSYWKVMGPTRVPRRTVLFQRERTGLTYRVPALLCVPPRPTLLAFAEQRLSPDDSHAHRLVLRRGTLTRGSVRWGTLSVLETAVLEEHRSMNPCPVLDEHSGTIFLFFIAVLGHTPEAVQIATGKNAARLCCVTSCDAGLTWGSVRDLTEEAIGAALQDWATFAVGPGHGVQLRSGRLLVPAYTYHVDRRECFGKICWTSPHSLAFYSDDHGISWHCGGLVPNLRSGECQLAAVDGDFLYCNARRARLHMGIYLSRSPLDPHSWTEPWVIYEGPSGYSDLAFLGPMPGASLVFACLFESGTRTSYEDISFCLFSLADVLENVPTGLEMLSLRDKAQGHCWPS